MNNFFYFNRESNKDIIVNIDWIGTNKYITTTQLRTLNLSLNVNSQAVESKKPKTKYDEYIDQQNTNVLTSQYHEASCLAFSDKISTRLPWHGS